MGEENSIFVTFKDETHQFFIEDIDPDILQETFELDEKPTSIFSVNSNLVIPLSKKKERLKAGETYYIKPKLRTSVPKNEERSINARYRDSIDSQEENEELALNALIASAAIYYPINEDNLPIGGNCSQYLHEQLTNHNFDFVVPNRFGDNHFMIAKEIGIDRIYIAFRGTKDLNDWKFNLQAFRQRCGSAIQGKFHSGFLQRALKFPMETILSDDNFKNSTVVLCGHSLGGAIASIVAVRLQQEKARNKLKGDVHCVTFGAPLFGDEELAHYLDTEANTLKNISSRMRNYVCSEDPIPKLLSYTQSLSSFSSNLDRQITLLSNTFSTSQEGASFHRQGTDRLIAQKDYCMDTLSKLVPLADATLEITSLVVPQANWARTGKNIVSLMSDLLRSSHGMRSGRSPESSIPKNYIYVPIGSFHFLDESLMKIRDFEYTDRKSIQEYLDYLIIQQDQGDKEYQENAHALTHYETLFRRCKDFKMPFGSYPAFHDLSVVYGDTIHSSVVERRVNFKQFFHPQIQKAELIKVTTPNATSPILRLTLTGRYLFDVVLHKCDFQLGFPFCKNDEKTRIKRLSTGENFERLILEEIMDKKNIECLVTMSDHGSMLLLTTQFGQCEYMLTRDNIRDLPIPSVNQIAQHDSVSMVIRKALQRGMAFAQIKRDSGTGSGASHNERIVQEVKELGNVALNEKEMEKMKKLFCDNSTQIQYILSNEEEFNKVNEFCNQIELFLKSPMRIEAEKSVTQKIGIALAVVVGGGAVGYIAGPGLVLIGILGEISATGFATGAALGATGAYISANAILNEQLVDSVYENALKWIVQELSKAREGKLSQERKQEVSDLRDDGSIFSNEKALVLLSDKEEDEALENEYCNDYSLFDGSSLSGCTDVSKLTVVKRIQAIQKIHKIREIFAQQCFIGIVGIQDAGKTTLLKKIWGIGGKTGFFTHTDVPMMYEINKKVFVIDFPGSNSLDYHAKTFSICGAMNNLIIVVIPFTGDVSQLVSEELARVFSVMKGSDATKVILCVNKCGPHLEKLQQEISTRRDGMETQSEEDAASSPISFLKKRFTDKLNEYYENKGIGIRIDIEDIMFTDWLIEDDQITSTQKFGLCGVSDVKLKIKQYLLKYGIYNKNEEELLKQCISPLSVQT